MLHLLPFFIFGMLLYRLPGLWRSRAALTVALVAASERLRRKTAAGKSRPLRKQIHTGSDAA
jgi:hypothetical protein